MDHSTCETCGADLKSGAGFCHRCGAQVVAPERSVERDGQLAEVDSRAERARELHQQGVLTEDEYQASLAALSGVVPERETLRLSKRMTVLLAVATLAVLLFVVVESLPLFRGAAGSSQTEKTMSAAEIDLDRAYHRQVMAVLESSAKDLEDFNASGSAGSLAVGLGKLKALELVAPPPWHNEAHAQLVSQIDGIQSSGADFYAAGASGNLLRVSVSGSSFVSRMSEADAIYKSMEAEDAKLGLQPVPFGSVSPGTSAAMTEAAYQAEVDSIATEVNAALGSFATALRDRNLPACDGSLARLEKVFLESATLEPPPVYSEAHVSLVAALYGYSEWASRMGTELHSGSASEVQALGPALDSIGQVFRSALDVIGPPGSAGGTEPSETSQPEQAPKPRPKISKVEKGTTLWRSLVNATAKQDQIDESRDMALSKAVATERYAMGLVKVNGYYPLVFFYIRDHVVPGGKHKGWETCGLIIPGGPLDATKVHEETWMDDVLAEAFVSYANSKWKADLEYE